MIATVAALFVELDAAFIARQQAWAETRVAAGKQYAEENSAKRRAMGEHAYYEGLFAAWGGKTWYNALNGRGAADRANVVAKRCKMIIEARNATIAAKLEKKGITALGKAEYLDTTNGFHGVFRFEKVRIEIETILAGGYNIQCLHQRTLVKIK